MCDTELLVVEYDEDDPPPPASWAEEWNKTVNRIRKFYGMPPVEEQQRG